MTVNVTLPMKPGIRRWSEAFLAILACLAVSAHAPAAEDLPGASDPDSLARYPRSWIVEYSAESASEYRLALGRLKKANSVVQPEKSHRLVGDLARVTYRVPDGHAPDQVFRWYRDQVEARTREILFLCHGRECGPSNDWANDLFGIPVLYGPDRDQSYMVARIAAGEREKFVVVYTIRRGNRRIYAHVDELTVRAGAAREVQPNPATLLSMLREHRRVTLPRLRFGEQQELLLGENEGIEPVVQALQLDIVLQVAVVAHARTGQGLEADFRVSQARARNVVDLLVRRGIPRERLYAHGAGSLSPPYDANEPAERVELVLP